MYLYYKEDGMIAGISDVKLREPFRYNHIEITLEQHRIIRNKKDTEIVYVIDGEIVLRQNIKSKREQLVEERDELLNEMSHYRNDPKYQAKLGLTSEDLEDLDEYWERLLDMPQHFDASDNQYDWCYKFVDVYTSGKNTNTYQLFRPKFIKVRNN